MGSVGNKYRVHEVAKDFGVPTKQITEILTKYAETPKNHMQVLGDRELSLIFESLTQHNQVSGIQAYGIRLFRVVGGIKAGDPFTQLVDDTNFDLRDFAGNTGQDHVYRPVGRLANPFCRLGESIVGSESGQHDAVAARPGIDPADFGGQLHRSSLSFRLTVFIIYLAIVAGDGKTGKEQQSEDA